MKVDLKGLSPISSAIEQVTGRRPNLSTCWRWSTKGIQNIRLETVVLGGKRMTTIAMVEAFIRSTTDARNASYKTQYIAPTKAREKQIEKASADLSAKLSKKRTKAKA